MDDLALLCDVIEGRTAAAVMRRGRAEAFYADPPPEKTAPRWAAVYRGQVRKIDTRLNAAVIDLGGGQEGLLPAKHARPGARPETEIAALLRAGDGVTVQVKSEGRATRGGEGAKLPRLTAKLYLPGLFLALRPHGEGVVVSRRAEDANLSRFAGLLRQGGGWIIQPAAARAREEDIRREAAHLAQTATALNAASGGAPGPLRPAPSALQRALFDYGATEFDHIHVAAREMLAEVEAWCAPLLPTLATSKRLRLFRPERTGERLFDLHDASAALEEAQHPHVPLPGGGSLIFDATAVATVIDVNQEGAGAVRDVNLAAAAETARQARLRNLGGALLVDFINTDKMSERIRLQTAAEEAFRADPVEAQVHGFTRLGILEITRKRRSATLSEVFEG